MQPFLVWADNHGAKLIGLASGVVAGLAAVPGLIAADNLKYWLASVAVLTVLQGYAQPAVKK